MMMENAEEIFQVLEDFSKRKPKTIPQELNDYLTYVARTGDPVYQWTLVKSLFKEKLLNVITDFYETTPGVDIPPYPNVDPFNYDIMKNSLLERLDSFTAAPFTVQRICELLTTPRKQYNRVDKFMRAVEKNILVVSTTEPGIQRHLEENGESMEPTVNGSDNNSDYNVDVEMEDMSWKDTAAQQKDEPQPSSSDAHITVDDVENRLQNKQDDSLDDNGNKTSSEYESVTPPEPTDHMTTDEQMSEKKTTLSTPEAVTTDVPEEPKSPVKSLQEDVKESKPDTETKVETTQSPPAPILIIPEIKVDDAEMTEQKLLDQANDTANKETTESIPEQTQETKPDEVKENIIEDKPVETQDTSSDENSSEMIMQDVPETKSAPEEVSTSSEESSSSDNTDGNSNSPKTDIETHIDTQEESSQDTKSDSETKPELVITEKSEAVIETENYSISDVKSELQVPENTEIVAVNPDDIPPEGSQPSEPVVVKEAKKEEVKVEGTEPKVETEVGKTD